MKNKHIPKRYLQLIAAGAFVLLALIAISQVAASQLNARLVGGSLEIRAVRDTACQEAFYECQEQAEKVYAQCSDDTDGIYDACVDAGLPEDDCFDQQLENSGICTDIIVAQLNECDEQRAACYTAKSLPIYKPN